MKLLRDFIRLRAAGRRLLSGHRDSSGRTYTVTVPQPLRDPASVLALRNSPVIGDVRASIDPAETLPSPRHLCLVSSQ
jgi:hypothetical protein